MPVWKFWMPPPLLPTKQNPMKCYLIFFFFCLHKYHSKLPTQSVLLLRIESVGDGNLFPRKGSEKGHDPSF